VLINLRNEEPCYSGHPFGTRGIVCNKGFLLNTETISGEYFVVIRWHEIKVVHQGYNVVVHQHRHTTALSSYRIVLQVVKHSAGFWFWYIAMVKSRLLVCLIPELEQKPETDKNRRNNPDRPASCLWCGLGTFLNRNQILFAFDATASCGLPYLEVVTTMGFTWSHVCTQLCCILMHRSPGDYTVGVAANFVLLKPTNKAFTYVQ